MCASVRVHVATYNTRVFTELCVLSMRATAGHPFELVVGDCGSTDGTIELLHDLERRGWLVVEQAPEGRSHGAWIDHWRQRSDVDHLVFVDSDVDFVGDGWLADLVETSRRTGAAVVCAAVSAEQWYDDPSLDEPYLVAARPDICVLLLDVEATRDVGAGFEYHKEVAAEMPNGFIGYDTGAWFTRAVEATGRAVVPIDDATRQKFIHFGGRTWAAARGQDVGWYNRLRMKAHVWRRLRRLRTRHFA